MYELATVDFIWIPSWDEEDKDDGQIKGHGLVAAHASCDICIWHLCSSNNDMNANLNYFLALEFRQKLVIDSTSAEVISLTDFYKLSKDFGLLIIGGR